MVNEQEIDSMAAKVYRTPTLQVYGQVSQLTGECGPGLADLHVGDSNTPGNQGWECS